MIAPKGYRQRIVVMTSNDKAFALPLWNRTCRLLSRHYDLCGIVVVPEKLVMYRGFKIPLWYLRVFGIVDSLLLLAFSLIQAFPRFIHGLTTWNRLGRALQVPVFRVDNPNSEETVTLVRSLRADVMLVMVGFILKSPILRSVSRGVINKHAAFLPTCRGLFPYLWSTIHDVPFAVSFHLVTESIDAGPILVQKPLPGPFRSMIHFYTDVFERFPRLALTAVDRLLSGQFVSPLRARQPSYFGLPTRRDVELFRSKGGRVITLRDFFIQ